MISLNSKSGMLPITFCTQEADKVNLPNEACCELNCDKMDKRGAIMIVVIIIVKVSFGFIFTVL